MLHLYFNTDDMIDGRWFDEIKEVAGTRWSKICKHRSAWR